MAYRIAVVVIGLVASALYAGWLDTPAGREWCARRTWATVVMGVGLTLALAACIVPFEWWLWVAGLFGATGLPIVARSLRNEMRREQAAKWSARDDDAA